MCIRCLFEFFFVSILFLSLLSTVLSYVVLLLLSNWENDALNIFHFYIFSLTNEQITQPSSTSHWNEILENFRIYLKRRNIRNWFNRKFIRWKDNFKLIVVHFYKSFDIFPIWDSIFVRRRSSLSLCFSHIT